MLQLIEKAHLWILRIKYAHGILVQSEAWQLC